MLRLALPVVFTYLSIMTMGAVDILFVGRVSASAVGAVGVGTSMFGWIMMFAMGMLAGLDYLISHAYGAGKYEECHRSWAQGVIISLAFGIPLTLLLLAFSQTLHLFGINPQVVPEAKQYLFILSFSLLPVVLFNSCQRYLQSVGWADPALIVLLLANLLNALANYLFVYGHWGFPAWGAQGSAIATLISRVFMMLSLAIFLYIWDRKNHRLIRGRFLQLDRPLLNRIMTLGLPSALQTLFEVGVFGLSTIMAARLAAQALAAHQIVLNIASLTFMVPLGLSSATAVLVGKSVGRGDLPDASRTGWIGLAAGTGFMFVSCVVMLVFSQPLLGFYTNSAPVIAIAQQVIFVAALFQLSDGAQVVATGALRGLADTRTPMIANLIGHWLVGLPVGIYLCFFRDMGIVGIWIGLSLGLTFVAAGLVWRWATLSALRVRQAVIT